MIRKRGADRVASLGAGRKLPTRVAPGYLGAVVKAGVSGFLGWDLKIGL